MHARGDATGPVTACDDLGIATGSKTLGKVAKSGFTVTKGAHRRRCAVAKTGEDGQ